MPQVGPFKPGDGVFRRLSSKILDCLGVVVPESQRLSVGIGVDAPWVYRIDVEAVLAHLQIVDDLLLKDVADV